MVLDTLSYPELRSFAAAWGLTQPRILALFIAVPLFARQTMPGMLRFGLAGGLGLLAAPPLLAHVAQVPDGLGLMLLVSKEAALGFVLGFVLALPFWAFEATGFFIDNQRGASIAATLNPLTGNDSSPLGQLFNQAFIVFVLVSGAFTIPMMKRLGYRPSFAAAVEASSSNGGIITPPIMGAMASHAALQALGHAVEWHDYAMGHSVCEEEIGDLNQWLLRVLATD